MANEKQHVASRAHDPKTTRQPKALQTEASTVPVTIRMPSVLKNRLQKIANADGRTLNNWILQQLKQATK